MKKYKSLFLPVLGGLFLIILGVLLLLSNLNLFTLNNQLVPGIILAIGGLLFLGVFLFDRDRWWSLIPGLLLCGIGARIVIGYFYPALPTTYDFAIMAFALGLAFWIIYINKTKHWWAIIPAGVLWSLALSSINPISTLPSESVFFIGLGITFLLLYLLPKSTGKMTWPLIPAAALVLIGILAMVGSINIVNYIWPMLLIIGGGVLLFFAVKRR